MAITDYALPAAARASCAAGPAFILATGFFFWFEQASGVPVSFNPELLVGIPWLLFAIPVGIIIAIVPNIVGTAILARLGSGNIGLRLPPIWALAGAAAVAIPLTVFADARNPAAHGLIATGAISALLCQRGMRWPD